MGILQETPFSMTQCSTEKRIDKKARAHGERFNKQYIYEVHEILFKKNKKLKAILVKKLNFTRNPLFL